jgi:hypothetical protein
MGGRSYGEWQLQTHNNPVQQPRRQMKFHSNGEGQVNSIRPRLPPDYSTSTDKLMQDG